MTRRIILLTLVLHAACRLDFSGPTLTAGDVRGTLVIDAPGGRVAAAGARVRLEGTSVSVKADAKGAFAVRGLPVGRYTVRFTSGPGETTLYGLRLRDIAVGTSESGTGVNLGTLVLGAAATLHGKVARAGSAVANATVVLVGVSETRSNAQGEYRFEGVVPGDHVVGAASTDGAKVTIAPSAPVTLTGKQDKTLDLELTSASTGAVSGTARLADKPTFEGIFISLVGASTYRLTEGTNADGFFADASAPAGIATVVLHKDGYRDATIPHVLIGGDEALLPETVLFPGEACSNGDTSGDADGDGTPDAQEDPGCRCDETGTKDTDLDGLCDPIDRDVDGDGIGNDVDNCPLAKNADQKDTGGTGAGDACDDRDEDTVLDAVDNCPDKPNTQQENTDAKPAGDACQDTDGDTILDTVDNCVDVANRLQENTDDKPAGDACQNSDADEVLDKDDNCPLVTNVQSENDDGDEFGNACDNCRAVANDDQHDRDNNGIGDACDAPPLGECVEQFCLEGPVLGVDTPVAASSRAGLTILVYAPDRITVNGAPGPLVPSAVAGIAFRAVHVVGASLAYAVGELGTVLRFDGAQWTVRSLPNAVTSEALDFVWASSDAFVVVGNKRGLFWRLDATTATAIPDVPGQDRFGVIALAGRTGDKVTAFRRAAAYDLSLPAAAWVLDDAAPIVDLGFGEGGEFVTSAVGVGTELVVSTWHELGFFGNSSGTEAATIRARSVAGVWSALFVSTELTPNVVDAKATNDVWAAGGTSLLHWNGTTLRRIPAPGSSTWYDRLLVVSATDVRAWGPSRTSVRYDGAALTNEFGEEQRSWVSASSGTTKIFAVEAGGGLYEGDGVTMTPVPVPTSAKLTSVFARSDTDIWVSGAEYAVLHRTGSTWSEVMPPIRPHATSTTLAGTATALWIYGVPDEFFTPRVAVQRLNNGAWEDRRLEHNGVADTIHAFAADDTRAFTAGHGGGVNMWSLASGWTNVRQGQESFGVLWVAPAGGPLYASDGSSGRFRYDNSGWTDEPPADPSISVWGLFGDASGNARSFGKKDNLPVFLTPSGAGWTTTPMPIDCLGSRSFVTLGAAQWAFGDTAICTRTTGDWKVAVPMNLRSLSGADLWIDASGDGWATYGSGFMRRSPAGWRTFPSPIDGLKAIHGRAANDVWAVGSVATEHWDGAKWEVTAIPGSPDLRDVWVAGDGTAWTIDGAGSIWRHAPGGNWVQTRTSVSVAEPCHASIRGVGSEIWASCGEELVKWDGSTWVNDRPGIEAFFDFSVVAPSRPSGASSTTLWVGARDHLLRRDATGWTDLSTALGVTDYDVTDIAVDGPSPVIAMNVFDNNDRVGTPKSRVVLAEGPSLRVLLSGVTLGVGSLAAVPGVANSVWVVSEANAQIYRGKFAPTN